MNFIDKNSQDGDGIDRLLLVNDKESCLEALRLEPCSTDSTKTETHVFLLYVLQFCSWLLTIPKNLWSANNTLQYTNDVIDLFLF